MTDITITRSDPRAAGATALLRASHALMEDLFAAESNHYLSIDALCSDDIAFFTAQCGTETLGCAALAVKTGYGEVKSMFVAPGVRGTGTGAALLQTLDDHARLLDLTHLRLETGNTLHAAHRLYEKAGFVYRGPFGDYNDDPTSLFMEKAL